MTAEEYEVEGMRHGIARMANPKDSIACCIYA